MLLARVAIAILLLLLPTALHAQAEKRIALLIGNKDYKAGVGSLTNPLNDIRIVGEALKAVGFEVLKPVENAQRSAMLIAIHAFAAKLKAAGPDAVGFLYYSGHGIASAGENYLIPTDVDEPSTVLLSVQGVKQSEVLGILRGEAPNAAHYLVLDACRHTLRGARGGKGFMPVGQQSGVLVAFAAEPGKTASDIGQGSGPYAAALATELVKPGQSDLIMFHNVRVAVMDKTNGDQVPWTEDGIQRRQRVSFAREGKPVPKQPVTSPASKREQPTTVGGMLQCESYSDRPACELDTSCAWVDDGRRCQRKSGSLATAMLEASPASKPAPKGPCAGVEALVGNEKRCLKPNDSFKDCPECPEMVVVPAGGFTMGSPESETGRSVGEGPQHTVTIARPFAVGATHVTRGEFAAFVAATGHKTDDGCYAFTGNTFVNMPKAGWRAPGFEQDDSHPVVCVSWQDAVAYAAWLKMKTGASYRLLSEAEAEYVARGTTKTGRQPRYFFGDDANDLCKYGNSADLTAKAKFTGGRITIPGMTFGDCNDGFALTAPAGRFKANAFGVKDVHGNALSWTDDCWHDSYKGAPSDGSAWTTACTDESLRVTRGGFWGGNPDLSRSAMRGFGTPVGRSDSLGLRVGRTLTPKS